MAAKVELFCLETFPSQLNPLNVVVSKYQFSNLFPNSSEYRCVLLLSTRRRQSSAKLDMLLCAHLSTEEETTECGPVQSCNAPLKLFTSKTFHRHYSIQMGTEGTVRLISPIGLSKIVIGARSRQSFKWASSDKFSNGLLILASCQKQTLVARQGDVLLLPYHPLFGDDIAQVHQHLFDLVVLECTPVTQGVITVNTSVTVTDCRELAQNHGAMELSNNAYTARTLTSLYASDFAHYADSLGGRSLLDNKQLVNSGFTAFLQALECRLDVRVVDVASLIRQGRIKPKEEHEAGIDVDGSVFVSKHLLLKLGLFNQEWVVLSAIGVASDKTKTSARGEHSPFPGRAGDPASGKDASKSRGCVHLASVVVVDFVKSPDLDLQDNMGFVSPALWFSLSNGDIVPVANRVMKIKRCNVPQPHPGIQLSESWSRTASPPFAKELHIQTIISPDYSSHGAFDSILSEHFSTPRLVQQGDVLAVPTEGRAEFLENNSDGFLRWPVLYFKVKNVCGTAGENGGISPSGFLADTVHTSLYMGGSMNSFVPYSCLGDTPSFWTSLSPPGLSNTVEQLVTVIQPYVNGGFAVLMGVCTVLLSGPSGSGKVTTVRAACRRLNLHFLKVDCVTLCADTPAACEARMQTAFSQAGLHHPCILLLSNLHLLGQQHDGASQEPRVLSALCRFIAGLPASVVVVGTVCNAHKLSPDVTAAFVHQVELESHTEEQRRAMLVSLSAGMPLGKDVNLGKMAKQTAGFLLGDFCALMTCAGKAAHRRLLNSCFPGGASPQDERDLRASGVSILAEDFASAVEQLQKAHSQAIGAPKIPTVKWQDVGGLQHVKKEILDTIQLPLEHPELVSLGLRRFGLLLYGPPGTGKTLLAKAVATECAMTFLSVKGPELINMYVGQSEENVREVFSKARAASPCIIFFDELDSLAPNRGRSGDSGGVMDRVVSQLLAELDGLHSTGDVFVIGATNRPDLLDQSLLRPGRFDKLVYVGISEDKESQLHVLKAIVRNFKVDPSVSLPNIAERCPPQLTGADMYALCSDAMTSAIKRKIALVTEGLDTEDSPLTLSAEDFGQALERLRPSVSDQDLVKYKLIQQKFTAK
ncbi:peroxisome assembly factor 2 [Megalops cyprinoides]|uniref:peroxisome assembly factor 2 n=1 Tax=Megalops cyprinoides TaxID=118141 RepID=UPI0018642371|nr:peroxisome assembly factor 2 [Megalops cyprinoides]